MEVNPANRKIARVGNRLNIDVPAGQRIQQKFVPVFENGYRGIRIRIYKVKTGDRRYLLGI